MNEYALLWMEDGEDMAVHTLVYRSPNGETVRTYPKGGLDPRAGDEDALERFTYPDTPIKVLRWMNQYRGMHCLVDVGIAKEIFPGTYPEPVV